MKLLLPTLLLTLLGVAACSLPDPVAETGDLSDYLDSLTTGTTHGIWIGAVTASMPSEPESASASTTAPAPTTSAGTGTGSGGSGSGNSSSTDSTGPGQETDSTDTGTDTDDDTGRS